MPNLAATSAASRTAIAARRWSRRWAPALTALLAALLLTGLRTAVPAPFGQLRLAAFDALQRLSPRQSAEPGPVAMVMIDEASLGRLGQWPWPRSALAALVRALQDAGAAAIVFDSVFAEPDRASPRRLAASWGLAAAAGLADYDADFAAAIGRGRVVLGVGLLPQPGNTDLDVKAGFANIGGDPSDGVSRFRGSVQNLASLQDAAAGLGSFTVVPDADQVVRRLPLLQALNGQLVPSLALEALRVARQLDTIAVKAERAGGRGGRVTGYTLRLGQLDIPAEADGSFWMHHAPLDPRDMVPAWRVLDAASRPAVRAAVGGRIVLIGASATGLVDLRSTPLDPLEPGVAIHADAIEQIVAGQVLRRPPWAPGAEPLAAVALAMVIGLLLSRASFRSASAAAVVLLAGVAVGDWLAFRHGLLFDPSLPVAAGVVGFVPASLVRYIVAERDALKLRAAFSHYLAPQLVARLARDPSQLRLGGEAREMTFLFTDLEGFTALTEKLGAEALVELLNDYLDGLCRIAVAHGGTVDKIVGDALHLMFNAPLDQPDHAARAVRCALEIDAFSVGFSRSQKQRGLAFGVTRIGVNSGRAVVGNFGGARRFDYTAHGDAINTAARLEAANKTLGTRICVAASTAAAVDAITLRPIGGVMLRGKAAPVEVFEPMPPEHPARGWLAEYAEAYARMAAGDPRGATGMLSLHALHPDDPLPALHARRIAEGQAMAAMAA